jgi:SAM-dependent methyltransferase
MSKLTGERPLESVTPDSILAVHAAGYRAVTERLGPGAMLDLGCGQGFESAGFLADDRTVLGVDYSVDAVRQARAQFGPRGLRVACMDAGRLGLTSGTVDWVCSSHLIEHFVDPDQHVAESARVLGPEGTAFFLTPNAPADFENPFHVRLFEPADLAETLSRHFRDVWVGGLDATPKVKADLDRRRQRADRLLALDVFGLRHRIPRSWYVGAYARLLPLAYRLLAREDTGGSTGISADDFFVTEELDETTLVLFAVASRPIAEPDVEGV